MKPETGDQHDDMSASLYLLGLLDGPDRVAFEGHLITCATCQNACDDTGPTASAISMFDPAAPVALLDAPEPGSTSERLVPEPPRPVPQRLPVPQQGRGLRQRPAASRRNRPIHTWTRSQLVLLSLSVVLAVSLGVLAGFVTWQPSTNPDQAGLVAVAESDTNDATVSIFVISRDQGSSVYATIAHLAVGAHYRLMAVTTTGDNITVTDWTGTDGLHQVSGNIDVSAKNLDLFAVVTDDGTSVLVARIER